MKYILALLVLTLNCQAGLIEYKQGDTTCEGYLADDFPTVSKTRPGVLVVHDWMGLNKFASQRADELAKLGYIVFAADIYGKGIRPKNPQEAGEQAGKFKSDRALLRARVQAALDVLAKNPAVARKHIAAIGYCFGGTTVLELARSGADVAGVVSFHGGLETPTPADAKNIQGKVLALHGADDPFVPPAEVAGFEAELTKAGVDWQLIKYSGAVHAFTNPDAGHDNAKGAAYNERADKRSWAALQQFFTEIFR